ncbi:MAG: hypothetical protein RRZ84_05020 [Romboutsia sp.]
MFKTFFKLIKKNDEEKEIILEKKWKANIIDTTLDEISITIDESYTEGTCEQKDSDNDLDCILDSKIKREKTIRAIDVYTNEEQIFKTHKECSRKLKIPLGYIKENLKYGYTDYFGEAISYLNKELDLSYTQYENLEYLSNNKTPTEIFSMLNDKIFTSKISQRKRDEILSSDKIEPINMHYKFECIDEDYDDYFKKYKSIIKRGGKKKIELVDKKGEVIEIFKSIDDCANHFGIEKSEIVNMLKCGENKIGRYEIRYSLRNI